MTGTLPLSSRIYDRLLVFYPEDLRRDYGAEMALVFAEDLAASRREAGLRGAFRVWRRALVEFFRLAPPHWAANPAVRVPAIMLAFSAFSRGIDLALLFARGAQARLHFVALIPMLSTLAVPMAVMWSCRDRALTELHLTAGER